MKENSKFDASKSNEVSSTLTRFGGKVPPLTKSTSTFLPNSTVTENGAKSQQKSLGRGSVGGFKGIWKRNSRKKSTLKGDADEWVDVGGVSEQPSARELPRRLSLRRKNSISGDKVTTNSALAPTHTYNVHIAIIT